MTELYNRRNIKERRRSLRNDATKAERLFWLYLRGNKTGVKFRRQYSVGSFILDFYSREVRIGIELDGMHHNTEEELARNAWRQSIIEQYNIKILRFRDEEILNGCDRALDVVKAEVAGRPHWPHRETPP